MHQRVKDQKLINYYLVSNRRLGQVGKDAMCTYIQEAKLDAESEVLKLVQEVFGSEEGNQARGAGKGSRKAGGRVPRS